MKLSLLTRSILVDLHALETGDTMETNPYEYDKTVPWIPQQNQLYKGRTVTARTNRHPYSQQDYLPQQRGIGQKPKPPERMPKAQTLALVRTFKQWLVVASLVGFGTFSGLAAYHQVGTANKQSNQTSSGPSQGIPATPSSSNGFFDQQGGNNFGSSNSSQGPFSGSSTS
jgi:hypothetical protein